MNCTACHREHRGRQASLIRTADSDCTVCHSKLANHYRGPEELPYKDVSGFTVDHPEFNWLREPKPRDPGNLRFNHKLHLTEGIPGIKDSKRLLTLGELTPADRKRYQRPQQDQRANAPVQLTCASCHVTESEDLGLSRAAWADLPVAALLPARRGADPMLPITFENQCRACHPLTFESKDGKLRGDGHAVPHRLQPPQVREFLEGFYTQRVLHNQADLFNTFIPTRPLPGKLLEERVARKLRELIAQKVDAAGEALFRSNQSCGLCHTPLEDKKARSGPFHPALKRTEVPDVWFRHAVFSHQAHRAVDCLQCHQGAPGSESATDVLLPGVQNCLQCHGPQRMKNGALVGGARFDCVECHRYHNGEAPLQGLGAARRGVPPEKRLSPLEFLSGRAKR